MTDFNNINPDRSLNAKFNTHRPAQGGQPDATAAQGQSGESVDPYADLKMDPDKMLNLLAAQGRVNTQTQIENPGIERSVGAFTQAVSPEQHSQVAQQMSQAYQHEFGVNPHPAVLQDLVDNHLIGKPVVQNP